MKTETRREFFRHVVTGGIAGTLATIATHPLDLLQTRLQSSRSLANIEAARTSSVFTQTYHGIANIVKFEGWRGLGRGLLPSLAGIVPARAIFFGVYEVSKSWMAARGYRPDSATSSLVCSAGGVMVNTIVLNPFFVLKTRMQIQEDVLALRVNGSQPRTYATYYQSYPDCIRRMWKHEGIRSFWRGLTASWLGISETALYFLLYERVKARLGLNVKMQRGQRNRFPAHTIIAVTSVVKMVASAATYPHEVIRTRMREIGLDGSLKYDGLRQTARMLWAEEGLAGLFAGLSAHLIRVVPTTAILFLSYEFLRNRVFQRGESDE